MATPSDRFSLYLSYPNTSYSNVRKALERIGYNVVSENGMVGSFKRNLQDDSELPVEIPIIDEIKKLNICLIAEQHQLGSRFRRELWVLNDE